MAPVERDDPTRETSASSNATAESICEDDWAELISLAKPGAQKHLQSFFFGGGGGRKSPPPVIEIFLPVQGQENPGGPRINGQTEVRCRLQGYEI